MSYKGYSAKKANPYKKSIKKKPIKKKKVMPDKITLPANAELKYNLVCTTNGSNKFYQIYVSHVEASMFNIYTAHGRIGSKAVVSLYNEKDYTLVAANSICNDIFKAKFNKGYVLSGKNVTAQVINKSESMIKKPGRPSKQEALKKQTEQQGTGRFSLINFD
jgi:hypothetical protein